MERLYDILNKKFVNSYFLREREEFLIKIMASLIRKKIKKVKLQKRTWFTIEFVGSFEKKDSVKYVNDEINTDSTK